MNKKWTKMNFNVSSGEIEWKFDENNRQKVAEVSKSYLKLPKNFLAFWWFWGKTKKFLGKKWKKLEENDANLRLSF